MGQWISSDLYVPLKPSRKPSNRNPVSFTGEALHSPVNPMPLAGDMWRVRSRLTEYHSQTMDFVSLHSTMTSAQLDSGQNETVDCHYDRWFVIQSVVDDHPISKLSPFMPENAICNTVGSLKTSSWKGGLYCHTKSYHQQAGQLGWLPCDSQPTQNTQYL